MLIMKSLYVGNVHTTLNTPILVKKKNKLIKKKKFDSMNKIHYYIHNSFLNLPKSIRNVHFNIIKQNDHSI